MIGRQYCLCWICLMSLGTYLHYCHNLSCMAINPVADAHFAKSTIIIYMYMHEVLCVCVSTVKFVWCHLWPSSFLICYPPLLSFAAIKLKLNRPSFYRESRVSSDYGFVCYSLLRHCTIRPALQRFVWAPEQCLRMVPHYRGFFFFNPGATFIHLLHSVVWRRGCLEPDCR
jgi:hypothetical protein